MSNTRLYTSLVIAIVVCVVLSSLAAWGVSSMVNAGTTTHSIAGPAGKDGSGGAKGAAGAAGEVGATGSAGAPGSVGATGVGTKGSTGAAGANGTNGAPGIQGVKGDTGDTGTTGASAPTFSFTSAGGLFALGTPGTWFPIVGPATAVPAGPALIGYNVQIESIPVPTTIACRLWNETAGTALTASQSAAMDPITFAAFQTTQVVTLPVDSIIDLECQATDIGISDYNYQDLSMYAISFAS